MPYSRKQIILKYKSKSIILTLESKDGQIGFSIPLEGMGELIIFKNETNFLKLGDKRNGKMKCGYNASEIVAAAIIKNGEINYSGGVQSFNWRTAKTKMFPPKTKEEEKNKYKLDGFTEMSKEPENIKEEIDENIRDAQNKVETEVCKLNREVYETSIFENIFPNAKWYKIEYKGVNWHYLTGEIYENGKLKATAVCVPGIYNRYPPKWLDGFTIFVPSGLNNSGYWISMKDSDGKRISRINRPVI